MHELSISRNIVAIVAEAAAGRTVTRVVLEIGKLSGIMPQAIAFCFDVTAQGTAVEGARLEIVEIDGVARCDACAAEFPTASVFGACACGSRRLSLVRGEELSVKAMELEQEAKSGHRFFA
jgi:hydrogenase nickel incorporation protein HypA/HybF